MDSLLKDNMTIFDYLYQDVKIVKPIKLIELFAGVGSQAMALRNIGADFEHYKVVEFDKFAIASYNAIHSTDFETTDITEIKGKDLEIVDTDDYCYILTYSFPCQDLSLAGNQQGMAKGSGTRSGLLWEVERLLDETEGLPQVLLMENVPQVISNSNIDDFHEWQSFLENKGYINYVDTLNAKDYGVAQNRNRTFMVSLLGEWNYKFPKTIPLTKTMKDYLEDEVDEKFYIDNDRSKELINQLIDRGQLEGYIGNINPSGNGMNGSVFGTDSECPTITTNKGEGLKICEENPVIIGGMQKNQAIKKDGVCTTLTSSMGTGGGYVPMITESPQRLGGLYDKEDRKHQAGAVWNKECVSPTLDTMQGGNREPMIIDNTQGFDGTRFYEDVCPTLRSQRSGLMITEPTIVASRGRNKVNPSDRTPGTEVEQRLEPNSQGICNTLTSVQKDNLVLEPSIQTPKRTEYGKAIRKDYESGKIKESRHNMTELRPRKDGISNTLTTVQKDNYLLEPIKIKQATKQGYIECKPGGVADLSYPESKTRRGRVQDGGDTCPTLTAAETGICRIETPYRIRKLTPLECWRLMGFIDEDFRKAEKVNSNSQLYKQAGNSIVVSVLEAIFRNLNIKGVERWSEYRYAERNYPVFSNGTI